MPARLIEGKQLLENTITDREIGNNEVDTNQLANGAVGPTQMDLTQSYTFTGGMTFNTVKPISNVGFTFNTVAPQCAVVPTNANDLVNKSYADGLVTGIKWREPVEVLMLVGNITLANLNALGDANDGDAYVMTTAGDTTQGTPITVAIGDLVEYDGTSWKIIVTNSGGFVPSGTRVILSTGTALISPYTDATDDGKIMDFTGASNTGVDTGDAVDESAVLVVGDGSFYEHNGYVCEGTVPTASWVQFTGAGQINAGSGLTKDGNTLNVGDAGKGIQVNANDLEFSASESAGLGLKADSDSWKLAVKLYATEVTAAGDSDAANNPIYLDSTNGMNVKIDNSTIDLDAANGYRLFVPNGGITGTQLNASVAGAGLAGGGGSVLSVGDAAKGIQVNANDLEFSASESAGPGLKAHTDSWKLTVKLLSAGGLQLAGGSTDELSIKADSTTGVTVCPITLAANGAGVTVDNATIAHTTGTMKVKDGGIGKTQLGVTFLQEAIATEAITGTDTAMSATLTQTPYSAANVLVFLNGILQEQGAGKDYTISGSTITWLASTGTAVDMTTNDSMWVCYMY